ncbi:MAG: hypothetical protein H6670_06930 [Anaerolineaceae bacterium]|nr:hypothetical protein [Anaerolineae bacterium]MCB9459367.1 hypothetical protein [Anaerolineaceae bacterium]
MTQHADDTLSKSNGRIVLLFLVTVPTIVILLIVYFSFRATNAGRVLTCTANVTSGGTVTLRVEPLQVSGVYHESHQFSYKETPESDESTVIFDMTLPNPTMVMNCADNIGSDGNVVWVWNDKQITATANSGESWHSWEVCDDPRPRFDCSQYEHLESVSFTEDGIGEATIYAPEGSYSILTSDGGASWTMAAP